MDDNDLTGTIPSTLGNLLELEELFLDMNRLEASMPSEICALTDGALKVVEATPPGSWSENNFTCDCCTGQSSPGVVD